MPTNDSNPLDSLPHDEWDRFISSILRPFLSFSKIDPMISREDLEQEAWVALIYASRNYDSRKSAKFTTYAYYYVRGRIMRYVLEKTRLTGRVDEEPTDVESGYLDTSLEDGELMRSIMGAVENEPHANFLVEHFVKGKSFRKIAKEFGLSHQGVAMHVKRLIGLLEKRLNHENA